MRWSPSLGRRELISGVSSVAFGTVVAGCLTSQTAGEYRIVSVEGLNRTRERHEVSVRISAGDETVYSDTHSLDRSTADSVDGFLIDEQIPAEKRPYMVEARLDGGEWTTYPPGNADTDCLKLLYLVEPTDNRFGGGLSAFVSSCDGGD